ncbi:MAG: carbamoyltransferase [Deltaproteobacteria bacterium]|nr:carbamoyltransferase [Deltaproteobacteria bacterium]
MNVLGISDNHGSGAALVVDGRLVAAVNEERLNREKNTMAFPWGSIAEVLKMGGLEPTDVDLIAVGSEYTPVFALRWLKNFHAGVKDKAKQFSYLFDLYVIYHLLVRTIGPLRRLELALSGALLRRAFRQRGFRCAVRFADHHTAHAYAAYLTGPFDDAMVVTADAMGDGLSVTVGIGRAGRVTRVFEQDGRCAFNPYYSRITQLLGFTPNRHEGKITGLAAYGNPDVLLKRFERHAHFRGPGFSTFFMWLPRIHRLGFYGKLKRYKREDVAAACQRNLENQMRRFVAYWVGRTECRNVVLAGGIFENVKLNQRIHEIEGIEGISIFPNMSDSGLAAGAALYEARAPREALVTPCLGMDYDPARVEAAAKNSGLSVARPKDTARAIAELLAQGKVVARFDGRMEYGPRALGHRSILFRPDDPKVNDWLNEKLRRTEFMPFAPVTRDVRAEDCYRGLAGAEFTARFMNICFDCTDLMKEKCPGVVHVDGTARPQIIGREEDPVYYDILEHFEALTGVPSLLNTSFNMHEEPIVATPEEAVKAFKAAKLDVLALGPFLLSAESAEERPAKRPAASRSAGAAEPMYAQAKGMAS